jgi:HK97 gp10 family phage protein
MIEFKVSGFKELERNLRKLPQEIAGKVLRESLRKAAQPVVEQAKTAAPRSTDPGSQGHLADSIALRSFKTEGLDDLEVNLWLGPSPKHFYGMFHEFGTRKMPARPFLRPAWDAQGNEVLDAFGRLLGAAIEKAARKLHKAARKLHKSK